MRTHAQSAAFWVRMQEGASRRANSAKRKLAWPQAIPPARPFFAFASAKATNGRPSERHEELRASASSLAKAKNALRSRENLQQSQLSPWRRRASPKLVRIRPVLRLHPPVRTPSSPDFLLAGTSRRDTTGIVSEKEKFQPPGAAFAGLMRHAVEAPQIWRAA